MSNTGFKIEGDWGLMKKRLSSTRLSADAKRIASNAVDTAAMYVRGQIRGRIRGGAYTANAALTILIKRSTKPLVRDSDLFNAVTTHKVDDKSAFVGVLRGTSSASGDDMVNIGETLHNGVAINVTDKMRGLFAILYKYGQGQMDKGGLGPRAQELADDLKDRVKQIRPLRATTRVIVIPPRHFISDVFNDPTVKKMCHNIWRRAGRAILEAGKPPAEPGGHSG